jgi:hypothetical protein
MKASNRICFALFRPIDFDLHWPYMKDKKY